MRKRYVGKALTNERKYRHIVELTIAADGLDVALGRRIIEFHNSRHIQLRHGRRIVGKAKSISAGAFPIWRPLAPSSNSLAERCAKLAFELGGQAAHAR